MELHHGHDEEEEEEEEEEAIPQEFQYQPLQEDGIRLIRLLPESTPDDVRCAMLYTTRANAENQYIALSYRWGSAKRTGEITLDGSPVHVTRNLYRALRAFVRSDENHADLFWIDALCINQSDTQERNHQVQNMGQIYSSALIVYAWLGRSSQESELAWSVLQKILSGEILLETFEDPDNSSIIFEYDNPTNLFSTKVLSSFICLLKAKYFERTWIIPEVARSKDLIAICGGNRIDWYWLHNLCRLYEAQDDQTENDHLLLFRRGNLLERQIRRPEQLSQRNLLEHSGAKMLDMCLFTFLESSCSDRRDYLFAMAAHPVMDQLAEIYRIKVDYSLTSDEVLMTAIEQRQRQMGKELGVEYRRWRYFLCDMNIEDQIHVHRKPGKELPAAAANQAR